MLDSLRASLSPLSLQESSHWFTVIITPASGVPVCDPFAFRKVSGLSRKFEVESLREGGNNTSTRSLLKGPASHGQVTLEYGFVYSTALWDWSKQVDATSTDFRRTVTIMHLSHTAVLGVPVSIRSYILTGAWPVEWRASDLDAQTGQLAIDSLVLAFDDMTIVTGANVALAVAGVAVGSSAIAAAASKAKLETTEFGLGLAFTFDFNPEQLSVSRSSTWGGAMDSVKDKNGKFVKVKPIGKAYPALRRPGAELDKLSLDNIVLDGPNTVTQVELLHSIVAGLTSTTGPSMVEFTWKDIKFRGGISSLSYKYVLFAADGTPWRATVSLAMDGQMISKTGTVLVDVSKDSGEA